MNDTQRKLALEILDEAIKITNETEYDVFVWYEANLEWITIHYYSANGEQAELPDKAGSEGELKAVLAKLAELRES